MIRDRGPDIDVDLAQVRAFTVTAALRHFGRAAGELGITQQALSKRIARLEARLGVRLLERGGGTGVRLTDAGARFLGPAREALAAGERALRAALGPQRPLRLDVWGHLYGPLRTLAHVLADAPHLDVEPGNGRDHPSVAQALLRGEADAGLGRVPTAPRHAPGLAHRVVRLEPVDAVVGAAHPLAGAGRLRPADLRDGTLHHPAEPGRLDFLSRFADRFGIARRTGGPNLGLAPLLAGLRDDPSGFSLFPADAAPDAATAGASGVRFIPLVAPTPLYAWSLLWRTGGATGTPDTARVPGGPGAPDSDGVPDSDGAPSGRGVPDLAGVPGGPLAPGPPGVPAGRGTPDPPGAPDGPGAPPALRPLLDAFARTARSRRWLEYDPARDWMPDALD